MNEESKLTESKLTESKLTESKLTESKLTESKWSSFQEFKWSTGEKYERSFKADKEKYILSDNKADYNNMKQLLFDDGTDSCMRISNKREDANTKLNERCMIESISQNPFLPRNNYINDLQVQDEFLKPRNSNFNIET